MKRPRWVDPISVREARDRLNQLHLDAAEIESQLRERKDDEEWRGRATRALAHINDERRRLRAYIKDNATDPMQLTSEELARVMADRVTKMERVTSVACAFVDDDSDEAFSALEDAVTDYRKHAPVVGG